MRSRRSRRRLADTPGERLVQATIIFARLTNKAEQCEKEKRACDQRPPKQLEVEGHGRVIPPNKACDLINVTVGIDNTRLRTGHDDIGCGWDGSEYLDEGNSHQADVSATIGIGSRLHVVLSAFVERVNGHD